MNVAIVTASVKNGTDTNIKVYPVEYAGYEINTVTALVEDDKDDKNLVISNFTIKNPRVGGLNEKLYFAATDEQYQNIRAARRYVDAAGIIKSFEGLLPLL